MAINEMMQKTRWGLEDFVSGAYGAMKHTAGSRNAKKAAFTTFFMAPALAIVAPYACAPGDDGGGNGGNPGAKKTDDPQDPVPGDNPQYNWEDFSQLAPFYSYLLTSTTDSIGPYGTNVNDSYAYSMDETKLVSAYNNDANFKAAVNNVLTPIMQGLGYAPDKIDSEIENLILSLSNDDQTDLVDGQPSVFFGYIPDGRGYLALSLTDQEGNPHVVVAVDNDNASNGSTPVTGITTLVNFIMNSADYGGGI